MLWLVTRKNKLLLSLIPGLARSFLITVSDAFFTPSVWSLLLVFTENAFISVLTIKYKSYLKNTLWFLKNFHISLSY